MNEKKDKLDEYDIIKISGDIIRLDKPVKILETIPPRFARKIRTDVNMILRIQLLTADGEHEQKVRRLLKELSEIKLESDIETDNSNEIVASTSDNLPDTPSQISLGTFSANCRAMKG